MPQFVVPRQGPDRCHPAGARRWLVSGSPRSLRDWVLEQELLEWRWLEHLEDFVRTGHNVQAHDGLSGDAWGVSQRGMRSVAGLSSAEVARRVPVPEGARQMLDIGGSHGYYSVVICRRHPGLRSVVLDLPQAICHAAPLLAQEGMGDRVVHRAGDATTDDFGTAAFDLVFIANVVHHFDVPTNRDLARRAAHALRREASSSSSISSGRARRRMPGRSAPSMICSSR